MVGSHFTSHLGGDNNQQLEFKLSSSNHVSDVIAQKTPCEESLGKVK